MAIFSAKKLAYWPVCPRQRECASRCAEDVEARIAIAIEPSPRLALRAALLTFDGDRQKGGNALELQTCHAPNESISRPRSDSEAQPGRCRKLGL